LTTISAGILFSAPGGWITGHPKVGLGWDEVSWFRMGKRFLEFLKFSGKL
jgi:hypothetical protein